MSEYREALVRMTLAIQTNPMVLSDAVIATEYHAAKALLARGEPEHPASGRERGMSGHGHVTPNPNGMKARCGGPGLCSQCAAELVQLQLTPITEGQLEASIESAKALGYQYVERGLLELQRSRETIAQVRELAERMREDIPPNHPEHSFFQHGKNYATGAWLASILSLLSAHDKPQSAGEAK